MTINAIEATTMGSGEGTLSLLLALEAATDIRRRAQEEAAAIDAEYILMQAEEANALDPVG